MRIDLSLRQLEAFVQVAWRQLSARGRRAGQAQPVLSRLIGRPSRRWARACSTATRGAWRSPPPGASCCPWLQRILRDFDSALSELGEFMQAQRSVDGGAAFGRHRAGAAGHGGAARTHPAVEFSIDRGACRCRWPP